jgi:glyoxylase-like metal-dependent hydrolase (beta-lactamase superfamily II)
MSLFGHRNMIRKVLIAAVVLVVLAAMFVASGLSWAHLAIRRERSPLPEVAALTAAMSADAPVRLAWLNTASQSMPRSGVLEAARDPHPAEPYVMSHPAFVLEWADGRILLIDAGMDREGASEFGRPIELLSGADPIQPHGSAAETLADAVPRVQAIIFTHLHTDHVGGIVDLCRRTGHPLRVFMTEAQAERPNYTTRPGLRLINDATCARRESLAGSPLISVPGFPGVHVIAAGGHTPGSQLIVAQVGAAAGQKRFVFVGDIVNHIDGITYDVPKPFLYRLLVVPEDSRRQSELRQFLRVLQQAGFTLLPAHDQRHIEALGISRW